MHKHVLKRINNQATTHLIHKLTSWTISGTFTGAKRRRTRRFIITIHIPLMITIVGFHIIKQPISALDPIFDDALVAILVQRAAHARDDFYARVTKGAGCPAGWEVGCVYGVDCRRECADEEEEKAPLCCMLQRKKLHCCCQFMIPDLIFLFTAVIQWRGSVDACSSKRERPAF